MNTKSLAVAAIILTVSFAVQAGPVLTFAGVGNGAMVNDFYNGGTDSQGNTGTNYGISFQNATAHYNKEGVYVAPSTSNSLIQMSYAAGSVMPGITFRADGSYLDAYSYILFQNQVLEATLVESGSYVPSYVSSTNKIPDWFAGETFAERIATDGFMTDSIKFNVVALDDIELNSYSMSNVAKHYFEDSQGRPINKKKGEVPLPGTAWLMLIGLLALSAGGLRKFFTQS